jgi:hypothetical protein
MEISLKKLAARAKIKSPDLLTRSVGRLLYGEIRKSMEIMADEEVLVVDFGGIQVIDSSFIDEFIVKLILNPDSSGRRYYLKIRNISEIGQMNIQSVFDSYAEFDGKKIVVMSEDICLNNNFFIGHLDPAETDIINYIRINRSAGAGDIASLTGVSRERSEDLLMTLHRLGIIRQNGEDRFLAL